MNKLEARRVSCIDRCRQGIITNKQAAESLEISVRQVQRLKRKADKKGDFGVLHGNRGKRPHNAYPPELQANVLKLASPKYSGYSYA